MNPIKHVAIIMDGNGRWGIKNKNNRNLGHQKGLSVIEKIINHTAKKKIPFLTLYTFSTENWKRPKIEINFLFKLLLDYLNKNKIALGITGTSNAVSVAEHVLTSFLYLTKNIHLSDKLTREGNFKNKSSLPNFFELYQKNVLILGFGRIGKEVAKRCKGFDSNVYVYDPFVENKDIENRNCIPINIEEGLRLADYITVHLPLNNKTKNFISSKEFSSMKKNSIIVNTARGGIINEKALIDALEKKNLLAAGIDVFEKEPPDQNNPLFELPNVLLSPHNAALTLECRKRMAREAAQLIVCYLKDKNKLNFSNLINIKELDLQI